LASGREFQSDRLLVRRQPRRRLASGAPVKLFGVVLLTERDPVGRRFSTRALLRLQVGPDIREHRGEAAVDVCHGEHDHHGDDDGDQGLFYERGAGAVAAEADAEHAHPGHLSLVRNERRAATLGGRPLLARGLLLSVLQPGRDGGERSTQIRADELDRTNDCDGDQGGDQAVLDGGGAGFVVGEAGKQVLHNIAPGHGLL